jgi:hypothetical protein
MAHNQANHGSKKFSKKEIYEEIGKQKYVDYLARSQMRKKALLVTMWNRRKGNGSSGGLGWSRGAEKGAKRGGEGKAGLGGGGGVGGAGDGIKNGESEDDMLRIIDDPSPTQPPSHHRKAPNLASPSLSKSSSQPHLKLRPQTSGSPARGNPRRKNTPQLISMDMEAELEELNNAGDFLNEAKHYNRREKRGKKSFYRATPRNIEKRNAGN